MLKIGDFSRLSRISIRMLRHYDEIGLLTPKTTDNFTSYRYYAEDQLPVAGRIAALREMGFGLSAISGILQSYDDPQALAEFLAIQQSEAQAEADEVRRRLLLLETAIQRLRKDETAMNYNVTVKTLPERYVASVRKVIPAYNEEGQLWGILMKETAPLHLQPDTGCSAIVLFHDDGYKESDVDIEIQLPVKGHYPNTQNVTFVQAPAVEYASATYKGSYDQLTTVNRAVAAWVKDSGYQFDSMMFCIYHVSPADTQNPDEYVTEVCYSIKKK